ncbi:MAG: fused MFS/spermidine synthase [Byssovorax sp.]
MLDVARRLEREVVVVRVRETVCGGHRRSIAPLGPRTNRRRAVRCRRIAPLNRAKVSLLLFGSGLSALAYQITWQRELRLIFGSSTAASAAVLAIFIGGMGTGGLLLGRTADRSPRPLRLYAQLELLIAAFTSLTPLFIGLSRAAYLALGGSVRLGLAGGTLLRLGLAALVLAVPTLLMGGTLPAAVRAVQTEGDARRRAVGLLYGANTLGAVAGAALATFWLLPRAGNRGSLWIACALNAAVALVALALARREEGAPVGAIEPQISAVDDVDQGPEAPRRFVYLASALVGFAFFVMELVWYRLLGPLLGGSVFTFGLILAVALLGIGLGGFAYGLSSAGGAAGKRATLGGFALTCALEAACLGLPFALGDRLALLALKLRPDGGSSLSAFLPGWALVAAIVVLPAAVVAGAQYPHLIALLGQGRDRVGSQIGVAAAFNTGGAMLGSLLGGFVLLPRLSAIGCFRAMVVLLAALGLGTLALSARWAPSRVEPASGPDAVLPRPFARTRLWIRRIAPSIPAILGLLFIAAPGPTAAFRHSPIGAGRVERSVAATPNTFRRFRNEIRHAVRWETEGVESSVALDATDGLAMVVNGKVDGNSRADAPTQVMGGLLGALLHPHPRSAMVIGLGTGSSAGWLGAVPSIERVDVAELEASMKEVARRCATVNHDVLGNPKVRILIGDARETLLTIPARYDVIFSEPSNPYRAGVASLFTAEYYQAIASRLEPGGVFLQWLQMYEIDRSTVTTIYATVGSVFPSVETWRLGSSDLVLVASKEALVHDAAALRARTAEEPYRSALHAAWRAEGIEGLLAHHVARPSLARRLGEGQTINTDDRNIVESGFAKNLGNFARVDTLFEEAKARGEEKPALLHDDVDPTRVVEERMMQLAAEGVEPELGEGLPVDLEVRGGAAINWVSGNLSGALAKWRFQTRGPIGAAETEMLAESLAEAGSDEALPYIDKLRADEPIEADAMLARLRVRQGRNDEALAALTKAFVGYRTDPWPSQAIMRRAMDVAEALSQTGAPAQNALLDLLGTPFAVQAVDVARLLESAWIAQRIEGSRRCVAGWEALEPYGPWDQETLTARRDCYLRTMDPRRWEAAEDVYRFERCEQEPSWLRCF